MAEEKRKNQKTIFYPKIFDEKEAQNYYEFLRDNIDWENGVQSRKGFTRMAKSIDLVSFTEDYALQEIIGLAVQRICPKESYTVLGIYLNYYMSGEMYTPSHSHPGQTQLIISLGATRSLHVGKRVFKMSNGDAIIFGSSPHQVPKEPEVMNGRISIALFMEKSDILV